MGLNQVHAKFWAVECAKRQLYEYIEMRLRPKIWLNHKDLCMSEILNSLMQSSLCADLYCDFKLHKFNNQGAHIIFVTWSF